MNKDFNKEVEFRILQIMLRYHCQKKHKEIATSGFCKECLQLMEYSRAKVELCPYKNKKPSCRKCPCYCFDEAYREKMKEMMHSSGFKMLLFHPLLTYRYYKRLTEI